MLKVLGRVFHSVKQVNLVGAATAAGQPKKGVERTPELLREQAILQFPGWTMHWADMVRDEDMMNSFNDIVLNRIKNLPQLGEYLQKLYMACSRAYTQPGFVLNIGGDHSIASATISAGITKYPDLGVIWVDAHADCNTPDLSPSKNYHGMPLAHILGWFRELSAFPWLTQLLGLNSIVLLGIRAVDEDEQMLIDLKNIKYYTAEDIKKLGIARVMSESLEFLEANGKKNLHLSLDVDGIDPLYFPGTGTPVGDGLTMDEMSILFDSLKSRGDNFVSMDLVELNYALEKQKTLESTRILLSKLFT